jgi:hypothetical protein
MVGRFPNLNALIDDGARSKLESNCDHMLSIIFSILHSVAVILDVNKAHKIIMIDDDVTSAQPYKATHVKEAPAVGYPSKSIETAPDNPCQNKKASVEQEK